MFKIIFYILNKILNNLDKILIVMQYCSLLVVMVCFCLFFVRARVNDSLFQQKHFYIHILTLRTQEGQNRVKQHARSLEANGNATSKERHSLAGAKMNKFSRVCEDGTGEKKPWKKKKICTGGAVILHLSRKMT